MAKDPVRYVHVPSAIWGASIEFYGWVCPLTPLEKRLREAGGGSGYQGGFIEHYILPLIYPHGLTREVQWILGSLVVLVNAVAYGLFFMQKRKKRQKEAAG